MLKDVVNMTALQIQRVKIGFSKHTLGFKSEDDHALWCLLKDLCVTIREQIFNFWHVRNGKYQKCVCVIYPVCLSFAYSYVTNP
jgi:hypothetical protein